ncbi:hypothetical protein XI06_31285 [Bradyrhizobium sp. CCBAU 11434]|nr:hypothetical protein [Bradyrhizobium sp. CCBAU 11434]
MPDGLFLDIIATSRVGPRLFRFAAQRASLLGCSDLEFVVAVAFGDDNRSSIGPPDARPEGPILS